MLKTIWDFFFCWHSWEDEEHGVLVMDSKNIGNWYQQRCCKCGARRVRRILG